MNVIEVGAVRITLVEEIVTPTSVRWLLPDAEQPYELLERCREWLEPHFINERGHLLQSVHSFVVEAAGQTIVVDTGVGNDKNREGGLEPWHMRDGPFLDDLEAAGFPPQSVDLVVATHMHGDHIGWDTRLVDGEWVPTFPNARYLWVDHEWEHMTELSEQAGGDSELMKNSLRPVFDAGRVELVLPDHRVSDGVWFEPTHGHTPGRVSIRISSRGEEAVISGDVMHAPIQCAAPEERPRLGPDDDREAARTRRQFLERYADSGVIVLGTHFHKPAAGLVTRDGAAYRYDAAGS